MASPLCSSSTSTSPEYQQINENYKKSNTNSWILDIKFIRQKNEQGAIILGKKKKGLIWAYILPILLQKGDEEIDTHLHILEDLLLFHWEVANSNTHAKDFFQLELNCGFCLIHLWLQWFLVTHKSRELTCIEWPK